MSEMINIIITVNSPGEVAGWLTPVVPALKSLPWPTFVSVCIPPCTFASGEESRVITNLPDVDLIINQNQLYHFIFFNRPPKGFQRTQHGLVLFLGGELTYAVLIAKRLNYPLVAYTEGRANWFNSLSALALPYQRMKDKLIQKGLAKDKIHVIGNLMLDAAQTKKPLEQIRPILRIGQRPFVLLMPGSRPGHVEYMASFLLKIAEQMLEVLPDLAIVFSISPFITDFQFSQALANPPDRQFGSGGIYTCGPLTHDGVSVLEVPGFVTTANGIKIMALRGRQYELMKAADLAISLPGTNTMELSFFGIPMVVTLPLNYPERIPLEGVIGVIGEIPLLGKCLKQKLIPRLNSKMKFTAWPNLLADDLLVPEIRGLLQAEDVTSVALDLIQNQARCLNISQRLQNIVGETGAVSRLQKLIQAVLLKYYRDLNILSRKVI